MLYSIIPQKLNGSIFKIKTVKYIKSQRFKTQKRNGFN